MLRSVGVDSKAYAFPLEERRGEFFVGVSVDGIKLRFGPYPTRQDALAARDAVLTNPTLWKDFGGRRVSGKWSA